MKNFAISLCFLLMTLVSFTASAQYQRGDVDHNGSVNIADVTSLVDYILYGTWDSDPGAPSDGYEYVDLGLPSGTLWATMNVGAARPEDVGSFFAWGETEPKECYDWSTYKWCDGSYNTLTKYCSQDGYGNIDNILELVPGDDAAYVNWGPCWRIPTQNQADELIGKCSWQWTTLNGVDGYMVTGPNGNSIFLPYSGTFNGSDFYDNVSIYWTRTRGSINSNQNAIKLFFSRWQVYISSDDRCYGLCVRAVYVWPNF